MKLVNKVAVPTTKLEKLALQNLKYNCIEKDTVMPNFLPLADENICNGTPSWLDELCAIYNRSDNRSATIINWEDRGDGVAIAETQYPDGTIQYEDITIPSNLNALVAYYRGIGRYRKAVMIEKKYKKFM